MGADRSLKNEKGQALLELVLLAPLFLANVLMLLFLIKALNARLTLIHVCRDTALALGRSDDDVQTVLKKVVQSRGLESLGTWSAEVQGTAGDSSGAGGFLGKISGILLAERLTVTLDLAPPAWMRMAHGPWAMQENVTFKRDAWKAPYMQAFKSLFSSL
jgi:hypothetical protein